jgi:hypothetical protein
MKNESRVLTDHRQIRNWVEERGGHPAAVEGTGSRDDAGLLRIDFPGDRDDRLEEIGWDEFFEKFDEKNLALLVQDRTADGNPSRFNKLVSRDNAGQHGR